jgi:hypothetical protein
MPVELTASQRLEQLLAALQSAYRANGPLTVAHLKELQEIVGLYRHDSR